jgi:hypothetical protein
MELPKEYGKAIGAVLTRLKRASLAEALRKATLIYGMSRNGNGMDESGKSEGRAEEITAQKRVWIEKATLPPAKAGDAPGEAWHFGVNPINANSKRDACIALIHAAILAQIEPSIEPDAAGRKRVYGEEFTAAADGILQHWPDGEAKPAGRVKGSKAFYATKALAAELDTILNTLPPLPFKYEASGRATLPVNVQISVRPESATDLEWVYRAPAIWPNRGKDDADIAANRDKALARYDEIKAHGMMIVSVTIDPAAKPEDQADQRKAAANDATTQWLAALQPHLDARAAQPAPEAQAEPERKVG